MAAARLEVATGTQSRAVPGRLEVSVFQVLHSPQALNEAQKSGLVFIFFHQDYSRLLHRPTLRPHQYFFVQALLRYQVTGDSFSQVSFLFSLLVPPWRRRLSKSQSCYSSNKSRSDPSKCSSCIKTLLQAFTGIQRSNRSVHTLP